ncbi:DMT family transporter [Desulfobotulus sp. H1]|uniref:DMT family transporter n=1 Tax=Desulfobotulus pelophilus TaxID=2823377 RepID=A0ABT3N6H4_9BACT|nr:DMT family transporter [Desulfobotulus pelophilus]MCW7753044.1 DMT family transporter [Desulfobotulus pelophilus]
MMKKNEVGAFLRSPSGAVVAGALFLVAAGFFLAVMGAMVKSATEDMPTAMVVFLRNAATCLFILPQLFWGPGARIGLRTGSFGLHLLRSLSGLVAMYAYFYALSVLPLGEAVLLSYTSPLLTPVVARIWLKEPLEGHHVVGGMLGFVGIVMILRPGFHEVHPAAVVALISAAFASIAMATVRKMGATEPPFRTVAWFTLLATLFSAPAALPVWQAMNVGLIVFIVCLGGVGFAAQICLTSGYGMAPSARIGPFTYSTVFFASILGTFVWGEILHPMTLAGGLLIVAGGIMAGRSV